MSLLKEFREFAVKGNVVDMAVGVMIGASFAAVVKTLVDEVVMPPIGLLTGKVDFADKYLLLRDGTTPAPYATLAEAKKAGAVVMTYGVFVNAVVSFLMVSLVLFFVVRWMNALRKSDTPAPATTKPCTFCKSEIHLEARRCPNCTSELEALA